MSTTAPAAPAPPTALAADLCWLLTRASQVQRAEFEAELANAVSELTPRKHQVLATALDEEHTQTQLARIVGLDKTTMMVTLDELERDGLAERRALPHDRRARVVAVTATGRRAMRRADAAFAAAQERILSRLPDDERDAFLRGLERLACPGCLEAREAGEAPAAGCRPAGA